MDFNVKIGHQISNGEGYDQDNGSLNYDTF